MPAGLFTSSVSGLLPWLPAAKALLPARLSSSGRIAVFSVSVFYDERIVVVAEQRPDASEEDSFQWMSRVLQVRPLVLGHAVSLGDFSAGGQT